MNNPDKLPDDPTELALLARDDTLPGATREAAWGKLIPFIERMARQVAATYSINRQQTQDLVKEAGGVVAPVLVQFDPNKRKVGKGGFIAWCRVVLRNYLVAKLRKEQRTGDGGPPWSPGNSHADVAIDTTRILDAAIDRHDPFSLKDLCRIRGWSVEERVLLLVLGGLWPKVPAGEWGCWVEECGHKPPFPPQEFVDCDEVTTRASLLAQLLGLSANTLAQRWCRKKQLLLSLDYIQGLYEG